MSTKYFSDRICIFSKIDFPNEFVHYKKNGIQRYLYRIFPMEFLDHMCFGGFDRVFELQIDAICLQLTFVFLKSKARDVQSLFRANKDENVCRGSSACMFTFVVPWIKGRMENENRKQNLHRNEPNTSTEPSTRTRTRTTSTRKGTGVDT